jgi:hypothetical protein
MKTYFTALKSGVGKRAPAGAPAPFSNFGAPAWHFAVNQK